jgi:endonuclease-3
MLHKSSPDQGGKKRHVKVEYEVPKTDVITKKPKIVVPNWETQLANIQIMRKNKDAPVDSMGCDVISDTKASPALCIMVQVPLQVNY